MRTGTQVFLGAFIGMCIFILALFAYFVPLYPDLGNDTPPPKEWE